MPTIIAFDTSSDIASVSLMLKNGEIATRSSSGMSTHSQSILPMVEALLAEASIRLADCDAIAFGCGPGSFTGVRTACGVAQGLGYGADLPLVPVVSLAAMAQMCFKQNNATNVLSILDARMKEVYWAQYKNENGVWRTLIEPRISSPADVIPIDLPDICGNGFTAYVNDFVNLPVLTNYPDIYPHSEAVADLALKAYQNGETITAYDAQPLYLRNKVAYTTEERRTMKVGKA